ncbi:MAG: hypothetical protein KME15_27445 [Drouetiella hepatica Uher 2000/2452]|uniref:Uncharacterized protein n=1 Tax=Drouetiella hepatica Uher 2000/2452 TaxID=904376 RepID=A0A951QIJ0_9CYAN|nr:hypothetical protein [Drouetiella hepatica Uher 2000/2452]
MQLTPVLLRTTIAYAKLMAAGERHEKIDRLVQEHPCKAANSVVKTSKPNGWQNTARPTGTNTLENKESARLGT